MSPTASLSLVFDLLGRDISASKAFKNVGDAADKAGKSGEGFGHSIKSGMGLAAGALAAAGIGTMFAGFVKDAAESAKIGRLTEAVLKSTGGAAKITADQVSALATSISNKTAVDDEAVQSASNLLLTFTKVRNETGKGNDIFNQATQAAIDMSVAMGTDANGAALQLGKALNDPIKGVTALSKAGVSFTQQQKDQIKAMVEAGDTLGAQKIILGEMQTQFGGAAAAAADPLARLKVIAGNLGEEIGGYLLPAVDKFATFASNTLLPAMQNAGGWMRDHLVPIFTGVGDAVSGVYDLIVNGDFSGKLRSAFNIEEDNPVVGWVLEAREAVMHAWDGITNFWDGLDLSGLGTRVMDAAIAAGGELLSGIKTGLDTGNWAPLGESIIGIIGDALSRIGELAGDLFSAISDLIKKVDWMGLAIELGKQVPTLLAGLAIGILNFDISGLLQGLADHWFEAFMAILAIVFMPAKWISKIGELLGKIPLAGKFIEWGLNGIKGLLDNIAGWVGDVIGGFVRGFIGEGTKIGSAFKSIFDTVKTQLFVWGDDVMIWFRALPGKFVQVAEDLGSQLRAKFDEIMAWIGSIVRNGVENITNIFRPVTTRLGEIAEGARAWVVERFSALRDGAVSIFTNAKDRVVSIFTGLRDGVSNAAQTAWTWVTGKFTSMKDGVVRIFTEIKDTVGRVWDGLTEKVKSPIRVAFTFVNENMIGPVNSILSKFPGGLRIPSLPRLREGGVVQGPGTGTSDSILGIDRNGVPTAKVSRGEFVVNEKATARNRSLLEALNSGRLPGFADGGFVGLLGDAWAGVKSAGSAVKNFAGDMLAKGARKAAGFIIEPLRRAANQLIPDLIPLNMLEGGINKLADAVLGKGDEADRANASATGPVGGGAAGGSWQALWAKVHAQFPSARKTSDYRPGDRGYHGRGKAVDIAGPRPGDARTMMAINRWAAASFGGSLAELIYTPGINLYRGRPHTYNAATRADHYDHVHMAAYKNGTDYVPVTAPALLHKGEAVLTAAENAARGGPVEITGRLSLDEDGFVRIVDGRLAQIDAARGRNIRSALG